MENTHQAQKSADTLAMLHRVSRYADFRATVRWLATLGYLTLGLYAGAVLGFQDSAFGIMAVLSCLASAAGVHVTAQVILILADMADAHVAVFEETRR